MAVTGNTLDSYEGMMRDIAQKQFKPVYLLMGNENYYIDKITEAIVNEALTEDERAFNLITYYGMDAELGNVINSAKSYPMGAEHSVVLLREAQHMRSLDDLTYYLKTLQDTTILVIIYKNGVVDRRKKFASAIQSKGILFESQKPKDAQLPGLVSSYVSNVGFRIDQKSANVIADSIGSDLTRLYGELDKLMVALSGQTKNITPQLVEEHIGISKDFNYFELQNALIEKDVFKANQIANYFDKNPKSTSVQVLLPMLFRFFSTAMIGFYSPDKSDRGLAQYLGIQDWQARRNVLPVLRNYSAKKVLQILDEIRVADGKSKGMNGSKVPSGDLVKELLYFILH